MKRRVVITALSITAVGLTVAQGIGATPPDSPSPSKDGYIVVLKEQDKRPALFASGKPRVDITATYGAALDGFSAQLSRDEVSELSGDPAVAYVERDGEGRINGQQTPKGVSRIRALENKALKTGDGKDERVDADIAVLDTGVADHPDLNVVKRVNCSKVDKCVEDEGMDDDGHGSNVAGIAAEIDNDQGFTGVAPGARIHSLKILDEEGRGSTSEIVGALDWVTAHADTIDVVNISAGYTGETRAIADAVNRAIAKGIVVVVSAGNDGKDAKSASPANIPDAITVSNLADGDGKAGGQGDFGWCNKDNKNKDDTLSGDSNFGPGIDIAAPGECIQATGNKNDYSNWSGTSQAAPHVAGAAALIVSGSEKPKDREGVMAVRDKLLKAGQDNWTDTSKDGTKEPLLDVHDAGVFKPAFADAQDPEQPGKPTEPGEPTRPGEPSEPGEPTKSGEPTEPGKPTASGEPSEPGTPEAPSAPGTGRIEVSCDSSGTSCDLDAGALGSADGTYTWDFGDGTTGTGAKVTHAFPKGLGTYAPTVTYTDRDGKTVKATATVSCADFYNQMCHGF
ncbi:S8 family serine peptidase [Streptomyces koelreuteriae]|uniref:S8 family serine peptidase n=1 Tax=Streptomyces koelreuteriae TaxID=2838015 RepID=UPI003EBEAC75